MRGYRFLWIVGLLPTTTFQVARAQSSPCLANPDTAAWHIASVTQTVTSGDSTRLAQQGLPYRPPEGVVLVTDSVICRSIIDAYNALDSIPSTNVSRAYVLKIGTTAYAMTADTEASVYVFFDASYRWIAGVVGLR